MEIWQNQRFRPLSNVLAYLSHCSMESLVGVSSTSEIVIIKAHNHPNRANRFLEIFI